MFTKHRYLSIVLIILFVFGLLTPLTNQSNVYGEESLEAVGQTQPSERPPNENPYKVNLLSRHFTPDSGVGRFIARGELGVVDENVDNIHVLLQLYNVPTNEQRKLLQNAGISLLNYIPYNTWFASVPKLQPETVLNQSAFSNLIRWFDVIQPEDKVHPEVWRGQFGGWAIVDEIDVRLDVLFFEDIDLETTAKSIIIKHDGVIEGELSASNQLTIVINQNEIQALALEDAIRWIDQIAPQPSLHNDGSRDATNVNIVQDAPYNLSGQQITVGVWDGGAVDDDHDDFDQSDGTSRVNIQTSTADRDHATHVAGTIAGNGSSSLSDGGTDEQWRGMAPFANIVSYDFNDPLNDYNQAINTFGVQVSNNSWGRCIAGPQFPTNSCGAIWPLGNCGDYGDYRYNAGDFDEIITGGEGSPVSIIFSAGNERNDGDCGMSGGPDFANYENISPPSTAKNVITVGAVNSNTNSMTTFSSWGPVDDGRLKPEIVAPGCQSSGDFGISSTIPDLFIDDDNDGVDDNDHPYDTMCGTSMAAPAVSGIVALMLEQHGRILHTPELWPSSIKALLVQSAVDLDDSTSWYNPGPDYASGYGLVDAKAAVDLIGGKAYQQGSISHDENNFFEIYIPENTLELKVTLAWDDPAAVENADPSLVNDLDLTLQSPLGSTDNYNSWILDSSSPADDASTGWDSINNLEQVVVSNPMAGKWRIQINGFIVPEGPQNYSLTTEAFFDILKPSAGSQVYAGASSAPQKIVIHTTKPMPGLQKGDFEISINSHNANIITLYEADDHYVIEALPPTLPSNGVYDLSVEVPGSSIMNLKEDSVIYADAANVDVNLVIDRSGSMSGSPMTAAKQAATQFVDLMNYGDMVGVVSFSSSVTTNYPLTAIPLPSSSPPIFSDNMEFGASNWSADLPWTRSDEAYYSSSHAWTDSPGGYYANNINISLESYYYYHIPSTTSNPALSFWHKYDLESSYDYGYIEVSNDYGSSWYQLGERINGTNTTWHQVQRDLSAYLGQDIMIRFRLETDSSVVRDGWYIDDVVIGESISSNVKMEAKDAISSISATGMTSIGGGLQTAQQQLTTYGNANHPWAIVLLTDGVENESPYVSQVLPDIVASKTVVHTIGLGSNVDQTQLLDIATQTGGTYNLAPTPEQLAGVYNAISGTVSNRQTLLSYTGTVVSGGSDIKQVVVDSTVSDATFSISWSDSSSDLNLSLRNPNGDPITPLSTIGNDDIEYVAGSTYEYYRIKRPTLMSGVWEMHTSGGTISSSDEKTVFTNETRSETYSASVTANASLTAKFYLDKENYFTNEPIKLITMLSDSQPITGATVVATITPPVSGSQALSESDWIEVNGDTMPDPAVMADLETRSAESRMTLQLYDDGQHGDGLAGDGVYANYYTSATTPGTYTFSVSAQGTSTAGDPFTRLAELSTYITESPDPPEPSTIFIPIVLKNYDPCVFTIKPNITAPADGVQLNTYHPTLSWQVYSGLRPGTWFQYWISTDSNFNSSNTIWGYSSAFDASTIVFGLEPNETYYWKAAYDYYSCNDVWRDGPYTDVRSFTTGSENAIPMPTLLSPADGSYVNTLIPTITWEPVTYLPSNCSFTYWITNDGYNTWTYGSAWPGSGASYPQENLLENTTYEWQAQYICYDNNGNDHRGPNTANRTLTTGTGLTIPGKPSLTSPAHGATITSTPLTLYWNSVAGAAEYQIRLSYQYEYNGSFYWTYYQFYSTGSSFQVYDWVLDPNTLYQWEVRARGNQAWGPWSDMRQFTTGSQVGISALALGQDETGRAIFDKDDGLMSGYHEYQENNIFKPEILPEPQIDD